MSKSGAVIAALSLLVACGDDGSLDGGLDALQPDVAAAASHWDWNGELPTCTDLAFTFVDATGEAARGIGEIGGGPQGDWIGCVIGQLAVEVHRRYDGKPTIVWNHVERRADLPGVGDEAFTGVVRGDDIEGVVAHKGGIDVVMYSSNVMAPSLPISVDQAGDLANAIFTLLGV